MVPLGKSKMTWHSEEVLKPCMLHCMIQRDQLHLNSSIDMSSEVMTAYFQNYLSVMIDNVIPLVIPAGNMQFHKSITMALRTCGSYYYGYAYSQRP